MKKYLRSSRKRLNVLCVPRKNLNDLSCDAVFSADVTQGTGHADCANEWWAFPLQALRRGRFDEAYNQLNNALDSEKVSDSAYRAS